MSRERFQEVVSEAIVSLPQDMKAVLRIAEDPEVDDDGRALAAGALMHALSSSNAIPGVRGILSYAGDALVLRLALERIEKSNPDAMARHREESPELFGPLDDQLAASREYLGELIQVLDKAVDGLVKINHHGHTPKECIGDTDGSTWLYDTVQEAIVEELEFDEDEVAREARNVDRILPQLRTRVPAK